MTFDLDTGSIHGQLPDGTPVEVEGYFWIPAGFLSMTFWLDFTLAGFIVAAGFVVVLFASILLHEWAHKMVAERHGIACYGLELNGFGGLAYLDATAMRGPAAVRVLVAGPLANLTIAALLFALAALLEPFRATVPDYVRAGSMFFHFGGGPGDLLHRILQAGWILNLALAAVNMLPAHPLDGGGIAVEWLLRRYSRRKANRVVAGFGIALGIVTSVVFLVSIFAGVVIYAPPSARVNLEVWEENAPPI